MSKDTPVVGQLASGLGSIFGASPMGQAIKVPNPPPPPPPPAPTEIPDSGNVLKKKQREKAAVAKVAGSGQASTLLSDSIRDRLGG